MACIHNEHLINLGTAPTINQNITNSHRIFFTPEDSKVNMHPLVVVAMWCKQWMTSHRLIHFTSQSHHTRMTPLPFPFGPVNQCRTNCDFPFQLVIQFNVGLFRITVDTFEQSKKNANEMEKTKIESALMSYSGSGFVVRQELVLPKEWYRMTNLNECPTMPRLSEVTENTENDADSTSI